MIAAYNCLSDKYTADSGVFLNARCLSLVFVRGFRKRARL